ncbi:MAG TPA: ParA family protein [Rubrivivax sp.]|nr:ParA family protein [Rubrivivax sp.]
MTAPVLTFFNNKGGVGKTSLVLHLAWMLSEMGRRVVAIDLDPQANLTSAFLAEDALEALWEPADGPASDRTIYQCLKPLTEMGDIAAPMTHAVHSGLHLVPGDLSLARLEGLLSQEWGNALGSAANARAFRVSSGFWQVAQLAAAQHRADLVLADVGPSLGAINRAALIATDHVVVPLAADMYSLQGLRNLGPTLRDWRADWQQRVAGWKQPSFALPAGHMQPLGYVLMQHIERLSRPVAAYKKWADRIPGTYAESVLQQPLARVQPADGNCLARLKHYRSLAPLAQEAHKPIFALTSADGAIGSHAAAVRDAYGDFKALAVAILERIAPATKSTP